MRPVKGGPEREEQVEPAEGNYDPRVPNRGEKRICELFAERVNPPFSAEQSVPGGEHLLATEAPPNSQSTQKGGE